MKPQHRGCGFIYVVKKYSKTVPLVFFQSVLFEQGLLTESME